MKVVLNEQTKTSRLNNSSSIYIPSDIVEKFNWKKGKTEFALYVDFIQQVVAIKKIN